MPQSRLDQLRNANPFRDVTPQLPISRAPSVLPIRSPYEQEAIRKGLIEPSPIPGITQPGPVVRRRRRVTRSQGEEPQVDTDLGPSAVGRAIQQGARAAPTEREIEQAQRRLEREQRLRERGVIVGTLERGEPITPPGILDLEARAELVESQRSFLGRTGQLFDISPEGQAIVTPVAPEKRRSERERLEQETRLLGLGTGLSGIVTGPVQLARDPIGTIGGTVRSITDPRFLEEQQRASQLRFGREFGQFAGLGGLLGSAAVGVAAPRVIPRVGKAVTPRIRAAVTPTRKVTTRQLGGIRGITEAREIPVKTPTGEVPLIRGLERFEIQVATRPSPLRTAIGKLPGIPKAKPKVQRFPGITIGEAAPISREPGLARIVSAGEVAIRGPRGAREFRLIGRGVEQALVTGDRQAVGFRSAVRAFRQPGDILKVGKDVGRTTSRNIRQFLRGERAIKTPTVTPTREGVLTRGIVTDIARIRRGGVDTRLFEAKGIAAIVPERGPIKLPTLTRTVGAITKLPDEQLPSVSRGGLKLITRRPTQVRLEQITGAGRQLAKQQVIKDLPRLQPDVTLPSFVTARPLAAQIGARLAPGIAIPRPTTEIMEIPRVSFGPQTVVGGLATGVTQARRQVQRPVERQIPTQIPELRLEPLQISRQEQRPITRQVPTTTTTQVQKQLTAQLPVLAPIATTMPTLPATIIPPTPSPIAIPFAFPKFSGLELFEKPKPLKAQPFKPEFIPSFEALFLGVEAPAPPAETVFTGLELRKLRPRRRRQRRSFFSLF